MAGSQMNKGPAAYGREALAEWGKAVRYGARAIAAKRSEGKEDRPPLIERLNPSTTDKGGRPGDVADKVLSKLGTPGKLASKLSLGSRIVERVSPDDQAQDRSAADSNEPIHSADVETSGLAGAPLPVVQSIDVAVPMGTTFELCTAFADYPDFLSRVSGVEEDDDTHVTFFVKVRGRARRLDVELIDFRENARLDWECAQEVEHSGVITFHPLAPRLTRIELTLELEPRGLFDRLACRVHLPERAIHEELHRFKAYAELSAQPDDAETEEDLADEEEPEEAADERLEDDELEDEEELDEEELDDEGEDNFDDEELDEEELEEEELEEEELEPAGSGR